MVFTFKNQGSYKERNVTKEVYKNVNVCMLEKKKYNY